MLEEISNLMELQEPETIYVLSKNQKEVIEKARLEIKTGHGISNDEADKHIDQWLNE